MKNIYFLLFLSNFIIIEANSQVISLTKAQKIKLNDTTMLLSSLGLRADNGDSVFVRDSLIFVPSRNFTFCIMEYVISSKSLLITAIHPNNQYSSMLYSHGKQDILVIPLAENKIYLYHTNIKGGFFHDFDLKTGTVFYKDYDNLIREVKTTRMAVWK